MKNGCAFEFILKHNNNLIYVHPIRLRENNSIFQTETLTNNEAIS